MSDSLPDPSPSAVMLFAASFLIAISSFAGVVNAQQSPMTVDQPVVQKGDDPDAVQPTPSPTPLSSPTPSLESKFLRNIFNDQKAIWTSPFAVHRHDARWMLPLGASMGALFYTDWRTARALSNDPTRLRVSRDISALGSAYATGGVAAAFYLYGRLGHDEHARRAGLLSGEALLDAAIVAQVLKFATQRPRPGSANEPGEFFNGGNSFPSGHSIAAWSVASVLACEYSSHRWVPVAAYGVATAVGVSRYTGQRHFISDVVAGSALGFAIGRYVCHQNRAQAESDGQPTSYHRRRWVPQVGPEYSAFQRGYGLSLTW
jgi:membrane-associated phospholipid phosphatase